MNEILLTDLEKGIYYSISDYQSTISKPVYNNGLLAYGIFDSDGDKVKLDFYVVKIRK